MVAYHSELIVLHCSSDTIAKCPVFQKKTGDYLLESASYASNFCWIWYILKYPYSRLLFIFGLTLVNPLLITCHDVIDVFRSTAIVYWSISFNQSTRAFFERLTNVWDPTRTNFFWQSNVHAILNVRWSH